MFHRASMGWNLVQQSWQVLKLDKELLVFPMLSGIACMLVMISFAAPMWATGFAEEVVAERAAGNNQDAVPIKQIIGGVILFAYYFVNYFVIIFFNSALVACAIIRFKGGNPNLQDGFSAAFARLPQIVGWALVAATVGFILKMIENYSERFGTIVAGLLGMAWSAVTFFVVPIIVVERKGPIEAGKRSFAILKKTWGEALTANFSISFVVFLFCLLGIVPMILGGFLIFSGMLWVGIVLVVVGLILLLLVSLVSSALHSIVVGALYLYAAEGKVPDQFNDQMFQQAFAHK